MNCINSCINSCIFKYLNVSNCFRKNQPNENNSTTKIVKTTQTIRDYTEEFEQIEIPSTPTL